MAGRKDQTLYLLYAVASVSSLVSLICSSIAWGYWQRTLNVCLEIDCGCILFGSWTFGAFYGGDGAMCRYPTFSTIPVILWCSAMFCYHCCCPPRLKPEIIDLQLSKGVLLRDNRRPRPEKPEKRRKLYLPALMGLLLSMLVFASAVILSHGYNVTCREYKKSVIDELSATGNLAMAIYDRLSCHSVFDLMDYLMPDPPTLPLRYRRGSWIINTGALLAASITSEWVAFFSLSLITYVNTCLSITGHLFKPF